MSDPAGTYFVGFDPGGYRGARAVLQLWRLRPDGVHELMLSTQEEGVYKLTSGAAPDGCPVSDLARELAALPGFRWMPGMLRDDGHRFIGLDPTNGEEHGFTAPADQGGGVHWCWPVHLVEANCTPDLTDPATLGCLLALVKEAWGDERAHLEWQRNPFTGVEFCRWAAGPVLGSGYPTEAAALVAALKAAPVKP